MNLSTYDQESTIRHRLMELDEQADLLRRLLLRQPQQLSTFQQMYDISWIYHENGLEGVVLSYAEIKSAVANYAISDVSLWSTYQGIQHQKYCFDVIRKKALDPQAVIDGNFLLHLHRKLHPHMNEEQRYRKDIPIHRTYFHEIAEPNRILALQDAVVASLQGPVESDRHAIEYAAQIHHDMMHCFPFAIGSGLIGRLVMNYLLLKAQCIPAVIHAADRQRYYEALKGPRHDFVFFLVEVLENSFENAFRLLGHKDRRMLDRLSVS